MKLIVGLGNPGSEYRQTRHNVGFMVVDKVLGQMSKLKVQNDNVKLKINKSCKALAVKIGEVVLAKPQTFMNGSGEAVSLLARYYRIPVGQIYVVHDDLDIVLGEYKIQFGKGPKIHNGINSIVKILKTDQFWRVRIGVENRTGEGKIPGKKYLLQNFSKEEQGIVGEVINKVIGELEDVFR